MTSQLEVEINKVASEKIRPLRHVELRKGRPFSTTSYLKDYEEETFHMACIVDDKIVTCATFYPERSINIKSDNAYRLRGMATDFNFQRKGYASNLMVSAFEELTKRDCDMVWCNARLVAVDFYKSIGFKISGNLFNIEGIGAHYYMDKEI